MKKILQRYRYSIILLRELVKTDFKLRYQNSILGYLWSLLRPLFLFLIMYVVFVKFLKVKYGVPHSAIYLLLGIVVWNYFTEVTSGGVQAIVGKGDLLRKINFPKYVIVLAGSFSALINLALNFVVVAVFMVFSKVTVGIDVLWIIPLLIEMFVFALAIAFILGTVFVKLRDMSFIWEVILQALFYGIPIFYPITSVPQKYDIAKIIMLNPMAQILQDFRYVVVTSQTKTMASVWHSSQYIRVIPIVIIIIFAVIAVRYFRSQSKNFAEEI